MLSNLENISSFHIWKVIYFDLADIVVYINVNLSDKTIRKLFVVKARLRKNLFGGAMN